MRIVSDFGLPNVRRPDDDPELGEQFGSIREKRINRLVDIATISSNHGDS